MGMHACQMTSRDAMRACFDAVTVNNASVMQLPDYGLRPGCHGDLVILQAHDAIEALRLRATRLFVVRRGRVLAQTAPATAKLTLPSRPAQTSWML